MSMECILNAKRRVSLLGLELYNHWPRRHLPKRFTLFAGVLSLIFLYFLLGHSFWSNNKISSNHNCIADLLSREGIQNPWGDDADGFQNEKLAFTGNGFIGLEAISDGQLVLFPNDSNSRSVLLTGLYPIVEMKLPIGINQEIVMADNHLIRRIQCATVANKCICLNWNVYAHRKKEGLLIQDFQIINPTGSSFTIFFKQRLSEGFEQRENLNVLTKSFGNNNKFTVAIKCTDIPKNAINIQPKIEEHFHFICIVGKGDADKDLVMQLSTQFASMNALNSEVLKQEHLNAWKLLNLPRLEISHSKAPNSLNQGDINKLHSLLLSSWPHTLTQESEYCFGGISTLVTPSKLWQKANDLRGILRIIDIWRTTLEHRGCSNLIRKFGAYGMAQAFFLSLAAGSYSRNAKRLEFGLNPETELHRNIKLHGVRIGDGGPLSVEFQLDANFKPFALIQNHNPLNPIYACTAGCQELPNEIANAPVSLVIKITRPATSILILSIEKAELELLSKTLHVIEIIDAPAHEKEKINLHKHGNAGNGGLPAIFWIFLVLLLVAFHLYLFKLLYSEWKNSTSTMPYSKFNKNVLFRR